MSILNNPPIPSHTPRTNEQTGMGGWVRLAGVGWGLPASKGLALLLFLCPDPVWALGTHLPTVRQIPLPWDFHS